MDERTEAKPLEIIFPDDIIELIKSRFQEIMQQISQDKEL